MYAEKVAAPHAMTPQQFSVGGHHPPPPTPPSTPLKSLQVWYDLPQTILFSDS